MVQRAITAAMLYDLVACPRRVWMDLYGDPVSRDDVSPFVKLLWERGTLYERELMAVQQEPFVDLSELAPDDREQATLAAMEAGELLIYGGRISAGGLVGQPDLLRREGEAYVPGDIKAGSGEEDAGDSEGEGKPKLHYAVQLALYADILIQLGYGAERRGFIWDIKGRDVRYDLSTPQSTRKPQSLWDEYQSVLEDARAIIAGGEPLAAATSACKLCHWHSSCMEVLSQSQDLTLIPELGRKLRDTLAVQFSGLGEFASCQPTAFVTGKNKTAFPGIGAERLEKFHRRAVLLTTPGAMPYLTQAVVIPFAERELFFDIEVDPMRDICYLHGVVERRGRDNSSEKFISFFADACDEISEKAAFANAFAFLTADPSAKIYYYSKYERTIYRKLQVKYPDVCVSEEVEALFDRARAVDLLYDVVMPSTEWPTHDRSIKTLAKYLGFSWRDSHPSGAASIEWFDRWVRDRDAAVLQRILDYNEDDCRATRVLLDGVRSLGEQYSP